jgi:hypothetical protein
MRVLDELRGSSASFSAREALFHRRQASSFAIAFSASRLAAYCLTSRLRRLFFSIELFFAFRSLLLFRV